MNFEELQQQWQNEEVATPEISLQDQQKINNPLQKIRKNMKMEFWSNLLIFIPSFPLVFFLIDNPKIKIYTIVIIIMIILVTAFYFNIFYKTYRNIHKNTLNTKDSLKDMLFQLRLNEQYYISYYLAFAPFLVCELIIIFEYTPISTIIKTNIMFVFIFFILIFGLLLLYFWGKIWFNELYGKYINQIEEKVMEISDLDREPDFGSTIFRTKSKNVWMTKTESFFEKKIGKYGSVLNVVFWFLIGFVALLIVSLVTGYAIGYMSVYLAN